jgi:hypothetical protein
MSLTDTQPVQKMAAFLPVSALNISSAANRQVIVPAFIKSILYESFVITFLP